MTVEIINVGFGDCYLLEYGESSLLVDCGTRSLVSVNHKGNFKDYVNEYVVPRLVSKEKSALITHFDTDHYCGFKHMENYNRLFDKMYIPYVLYQSRKRYVILENAVNLYLLFQENTLSGGLASNILHHPKVLSELTVSNSIEILYTGKKINMGNKTFDVIWPDIDYEIDASLVELLENVDFIIKDNFHDDKYNQYQQIREHICSIYKKWVEELKAQRYENVYDILKQYVSALEKLGEFIAHNKEIIQKMREFLPNKITSYLVKKFITSSNATSIVFHDKDICMTGDITKDIVEIFLHSRFEKHYKFFKIPHHGTEGYYSPFLPKDVGYALCPIGKMKKAKGDYEISYKYTKHFCGSSIIICNNADSCCELLRKMDWICVCCKKKSLCIHNLKHKCGIGHSFKLF